MSMSRVPTDSHLKTAAPKSSGLVAMEARSVDAIPRGAEWQYEPKWDGFRCLLSRIHPAQSRITKLSQQTPALFLVFDLLATAKDKKLTAQPLNKRRPAL